jgi:hypothetical protein
VYLRTVFLLTVILPIGSIGVEHFFFHHSVPLMLLAGKWFVFWSAGVRLFAAGLRQFFQPRFTTEKIFGIKSDDALPFVRELGIANFATGIIGIASLFKPGFVLPVAITAGIFFGITGIRHAAQGSPPANKNVQKRRTSGENIAMASDLLVFLVFVAYVSYASVV